MDNSTDLLRSNAIMALPKSDQLVNADQIIAKADAVRKHLSRIKTKAEIDLETFLADIDTQEIVLFNLQMAIQNCIDIAAQIITDENLVVAASKNEMFYILQENAFITPDLSKKMIQAIGIFNLITYEFDKIDLKKVLNVAKKDIKDLSDFIDAIFQKTKINTKPNKPKSSNAKQIFKHLTELSEDFMPNGQKQPPPQEREPL